MKLTVDGYMVHETESVFEITYHWYNAETSLAEPITVVAGGTDARIWKNYWPCSVECLEINKANQYSPLVEPPPTVKMIAPCQAK